MGGPNVPHEKVNRHRITRDTGLREKMNGHRISPEKVN
jgi:hypothetical protein